MALPYVNWQDFGYVKGPQGWQKGPGMFGYVPPAAGAGGGGTIDGPGGRALPGSYTGAAGGIPQTTPPTQSMADLLAGITQNLGALGPVIGGITGAESQALRNQYPGEYFTGLGTALGNVNQRLKGNINDLLPGLFQNVAEAGIGSGVDVNSPAGQSKLARDVLGSQYAVQQQGLQGLGAIQNLIPKVSPYGAEQLVANIGQQVASDYMRNLFGAAPIPEAAYQRSRADALAGLNRGFNAGGGGGYGGGFNMFNPFAAMGTPALGTPAADVYGFGARNAYDPTKPSFVGEDPSVIRGMPANVGGLPGAQGQVPAEYGPEFFPGYYGAPQPLGPVYGPSYFGTQPNLWDLPPYLDVGSGEEEMIDYG